MHHPQADPDFQRRLTDVERVQQVHSTTLDGLRPYMDSIHSLPTWMQSVNEQLASHNLFIQAQASFSE